MRATCSNILPPTGTPAPSKSPKLFGIVHHLGLMHEPQQRPSRFMLTAAPAAHLHNVGGICKT
jgi:hypothetical protein